MAECGTCSAQSLEWEWVAGIEFRLYGYRTETSLASKFRTPAPAGTRGIRDRTAFGRLTRGRRLADRYPCELRGCAARASQRLFCRCRRLDGPGGFATVRTAVGRCCWTRRRAGRSLHASLDPRKRGTSARFLLRTEHVFHRPIFVAALMKVEPASLVPVNANNREGDH
jgi:hypothetical protein